MKTYPNIAAAVADTSSETSKAMAKWREARNEAQREVARLMETEGLTREQAWAKALA